MKTYKLLLLEEEKNYYHKVFINPAYIYTPYIPTTISGVFQLNNEQKEMIKKYLSIRK